MVLLLARTHYSLLTGPSSPQALAEAAVRAGHNHLALVDGNGLYGLWPFAQATRRLGLQAVFGCELAHAGRRLFVFAQGRAGYASLCELLTARNLDPEFDLSRAAARLSDGLLFLCRDLELLPQLAVRVPRERLFVAVGPRLVRDAGAPSPPAPDEAPMEAIAENHRKALDPDAGPPRSKLLQAARDLDLEPCAVHDVWFAEAQDYARHVLFAAVKHNRTLRAVDERGLAGVSLAAPWMHVKSQLECAAGHDDVPRAVENAQRVLASCTLSFADDAKPIFPSFTSPEGSTPACYLAALAQAGLQRKLASRRASASECDTAQRRLARELAVIEAMGFAPYFLVVREIAELAAERGIPCLGRGSAADSLVAYALGLTEADPIRYGLLFERFLNPARKDLPDIDLDFCWRRRDELLAAVYAHFGDDRVAMIATYNTCGPRAAYLEAAKAGGVPPMEAARRSKLLPWHAHAGEGLLRAIAATKGFYAQRALPPERERAIEHAAQALLDAPRHLGVHPGGIVITPGPVARHAPLERSQKGVVVTQYDKRFVEALGLVKIDLLGNRALTIVDDCVRSLHKHGIEAPDLAAVAEDDPKTVALLQTGRTLGCFQVESPAMRTLLRQMQAPNMDRVIQAVALVRPGPAASGMKDAFLRRARGLEDVSTAHPLLAATFADTFGIMLYQEDVIRAAMAVAGIDAESGDTLRRQMGSRDGASKKDLEGFVLAGLRRGLARQEVESIWAEMARFSAYSFCKAHAVTYGRLAFRCVYLKAHWPVAFLCAMLDNDAGYFDTGVYVEESKRLGAILLPPCVQHGEDRFSLEGPRHIRVGFGQVRGVTQRTREQITAARRSGGLFRSFDDFLRRVEPQRDEAESLVRVGACDALSTSRRELLWRLHVARNPTVEAQRARAEQKGALFHDALLPREVAFPALPDYDAMDRTRSELELLGYALGAHPVDVLWRDDSSAARLCVPCGRVEEHIGEAIAIRGWLVAWRQHRTENGDAMAFATIEDGSGLVETTLFPKVYEQCGGAFCGRGPYVVRGVVEERLGGVGLRVTAVAGPQERASAQSALLRQGGLSP
ncbi:MAG: hypothetical protein RLZZ562_3475 [Planctomycetota bacterium]